MKKVELEMSSAAAPDYRAYQASAQLCTRLLEGSGIVPAGNLLARWAVRIRWSWKASVVTVCFWVIYGYAYAEWLLHH